MGRTGKLAGALSALAAIAAAKPAWAAEQAPREPEIHYELHVSLESEAHVVTGRASISLTNTTAKELHELWFHLYLNAFESEKTLFMRPRKSGGSASRSGPAGGKRGHTRVLTLFSPQFPAIDLWSSAAPHSPGDPEDRTDIRVPLPAPLARGAKLELEAEFESQLPEAVERSGFVDEFHLIAQFFPKLGRLRQNGSWEHFAYHPFAEFSANFGNYVAHLEAPAGHVIGATGGLTPEPSPEGRQAWLARAEHVHDFAWVSAPGLEDETEQIGTVQVRLLSPSHARRSREASWETLRNALPFYQAWLGPYPYPTLTVVLPPERAYRTGGMEYPTFITTATSEWPQLLGLRGIELVTAHELGHQWFQGIVASSEVATPYLDEGLTSFIEQEFMEDRWGSGSAYDTPWLQVSGVTGRRHQVLAWAPHTSALLAAPNYRNFSELSVALYARVPLVLGTLQGVYGKERLRAALAHYARRYRFAHPTSQDFIESVGEQLAPDGASILKRLLEGKNAGYRLHGWVTEAHREGGLVSRVECSVEGGVALRSKVLVRLQSGATLEVPVQGGQTVTFRHEEPAISAEVDPGRTLLLDPDLSNNRITLKRENPSRLSLLVAEIWAILLFVWGLS